MNDMNIETDQLCMRTYFDYPWSRLAQSIIGQDILSFVGSKYFLILFSFTADGLLWLYDA